MLKIVRVLMPAVLLAAFGLAHSQAYPTKPVRIIIPVSPGSSPDIVARMLADRLTRGLGQQFLPENNTAGAGLVAAQQAARATPDGYVLFIGASSALASNPHMFKSLPYDPIKDFTPIANLAEVAFAMAVNPEVPVKTIGEWIAYAKARPGKLSFAADAGIAGIVGAWFNKTAGIDVLHVSYKILAPQFQDTVSGRVQMIVVPLAPIESFVKSGKLRVLGVSSSKRGPGMENIPSIAETLPGFQVTGWFLLAGPTGTPAAVVRRLNHETELFLKDPEVLERFRAFGFTASGAGTPESLREFVRAELERWGRITKEVGIKPQ